MIRLFTRFTVILSLLIALTLGVIALLLGKPTEATWAILWEKQFESYPVSLIMLAAIVTLTFFIVCWMSFLSMAKERFATKHLKKVVDPAYEPAAQRGLSRSMRKALVETTDLIEAQKSALQRLSNEKAETNDMIVQEQLLAERQRLARELHDSVSQQLFAASMLLSALTEQAEDEAAEKSLQQVEKVVQQAQLEMRALLLHLRPVELRNKTLAEGLTSLISELQEKAYFHVEARIEEFPLSKAEEDHLFRIAQEALSNTLRHAKASLVEVVLVERGDIGMLRIQDNGLGFELESANTSSYGLKNIAERAVEIGCQYKIVSVPGDGTVVEVKVQRQKGEQHDQTPNRR